MTTAMKVSQYLNHQKIVFGEMQLQKLLYYSQAWSLAWTGKPLFGDEIEAWKGGPVVRSVWAANRYNDYVVVDDGSQLSDDDKAVIDAVYAHYGKNGGGVLSAMTHVELPWTEARGDLPPGAGSTAPVSQATMRRYYTKVLIEGGDAPTAPVQSRPADPDETAVARQRQSKRWRGALDALALR